MDSPHDNIHLPQADDSVAAMEIMAHPQTGTAKPISTDLLFSLPPELLLPIFSFVGVEYFREDVRRLAVCKKWYAYAQPVLLGNLRLWPPKGLLPMLRATEGGPSLEAARHMTKHIDVNVGCWPSAFDLEPLASRLQDFAALRTLVIRSRVDGGFLQMSSLSSQGLSNLTVLQQLTSLEIDLEDVDLQEGGAHLCKSISQRIPTLKRLRCRLPYICNDLLGTPPGNLEELIICIAFQNKTWFTTRHCSTGIWFCETEHRTILETRLAQFAASMREPKIVRLVHHLCTSHRTYAFDAIRKRRSFLGQFPAWDADGVLLPEDWDEDEESESEEFDYWGSEDWEFEENQNWEEDEESDEGEETDELSDAHENLLDEPLSD